MPLKNSRILKAEGYDQFCFLQVQMQIFLHHPRQHHAGGDTGEGAEQSARQRPAGLRHLCGQEIDAHGIEHGLGATHHDRRGQADAGIRSIGFINVQSQRSGCRGRKQANDGERDQLYWKMQQFRRPRQAVRRKIQEAGRPQHPHRRHKPYQRREDLQNCPDSVRGSGDKLVIDMYLLRQRISHNIENDNGYDKVRDIIEKSQYDLILLDVMLPKVDGYELLEYIKQVQDTPVIFITAKAQIKDKIKGLKEGADDYITKPFVMEELLARVEAVLRRYNKLSENICIDNIIINSIARTVKKDNEKVDLTPKEFDLLMLLVQNKNTALYREIIFEKVWGEELEFETRTLDLHIQRLRKKLGWKDRIKTVYRIGYMLEI